MLFCLPCLSGMLFPRHPGNHLKNLKEASHSALTQQLQEDGLEETANPPKTSLFLEWTWMTPVRFCPSTIPSCPWRSHSFWKFLEPLSGGGSV